MTFRPTALVFAPGCALLGAAVGGWQGALIGIGVLFVLVAIGTAVHARVSRAALAARALEQPAARVTRPMAPAPDPDPLRQGMGMGRPAP